MQIYNILSMENYSIVHSTSPGHMKYISMQLIQHIESKLSFISVLSVFCVYRHKKMQIYNIFTMQNYSIVLYIIWSHEI
jgi:hypothetical protein